jgi:hypothetical protein
LGKRWGRGESHTGDGFLGEAVRNLDPDSGSMRVEIGYGCAGRKVESTGARVGNASVGGRRVGGIAAGRQSIIIIVFTQVIRIFIYAISHPPPSGARRVPALVLLATAQGVGRSGIVAVAN